MIKIQEMRAFQQTVQAYTHTTASPVSPRNGKNPGTKSPSAANAHTASTNDTSKMLQRELVPSFLKALYITSEDTIFDDDEVMCTQHSLVPLGLKSLTNSAAGALSAPEALKLRMQEINRSKSALATSSNQQMLSQSQLDVPAGHQKHHHAPGQPSTSKQI